ncbi:hypothetical protein QO014_003163 [Kaistia dalseonensis]|uniref:Uncharacterized protein n=1 Tax=Kaistia dalseonensis TaxID=410840 RepID=A0ABU0H8X2_9HYPH|nr:hypothetical protein [Kaistia dalseonensis]MDQ0438768.1 hypothetical protein [Kaistia dalseonensis]
MSERPDFSVMKCPFSRFQPEETDRLLSKLCAKKNPQKADFLQNGILTIICIRVENIGSMRPS